jgi:hypothetical protein
MVTAIALVPSHPHLLVSASADGTVRTWRHLQGKQLHCERIAGCAAAEGEKGVIARLACSPVNGDVAVVVEGYEALALRFFSLCVSMPWPNPCNTPR